MSQKECISVLPDEPCPNCGWQYGDLEPHQVLPNGHPHKCLRCNVTINLDALACSACGFVPGVQPVGLTRTKDARAELFTLKNQLRAARGMPPLEIPQEPQVDRDAGVVNLGRLHGVVTPDRCTRCRWAWNLDAIACCHCGYIPDSTTELNRLLADKNARRAQRNLPPLKLPSQAAPVPAKVVMHPSANDEVVARRHREKHTIG